MSSSRARAAADLRGSSITQESIGGCRATADLRGSSIAQESTGGCCATADLKGSSIAQESTGGHYAVTDLRGSSITQESTGGHYVGGCRSADCCCGSCSCGSVIQCGMSQNELGVKLIGVLFLFQLLQVCSNYNIWTQPHSVHCNCFRCRNFPKLSQYFSSFRSAV